MCFSATASFGAAALLAATGAATLSKAKRAAERPLAAMPLVFALQQGIEGLLWLSVPTGHPAGRALATAFAVIAMVVWPVLTPLAMGLAETNLRRKRWIMALTGAGLGVAGYSLLDIWDHPYMARPAPHSLIYINDSPFPNLLMGAYLVAVCLPPLLSTSPALKCFGVTVTVGLAITLGFFFVSLVSVWCFFAAIASAILVTYFYSPAKNTYAAGDYAARP